MTSPENKDNVPFINPGKWPKTPSRMLLHLTHGVFNDGYKEGEDEQKDTMLMLISVIGKQDTKRVLLDGDLMEDIQEVPETGETETRWPFDNEFCIEITNPFQTNPGSPEPPKFMQGMIVLGNEDERGIVFMFTQQDEITLPTFLFRASTGGTRPFEEIMRPGHDPNNDTGLLVRNILAHINRPSNRLAEEPLNRQQRRQMERNGTGNPWLVIRRFRPEPSGRVTDS